MTQLDSHRHRRYAFALPSPALLLLLLAGLVAMRVRVVERMIGSYLGCPGCFDAMVWAADAVLFTVVAALLLLAGLLRPEWAARALQVLAGAVLVLFAADLAVFRLFNSRLFLSDLRLWAAEPAAVWNQFSSGLGGALPAAVVLAGVFAMLAWLACARPARQRSARLLLSAALALSLVAAAFTRPGVYVNDWAIDNFLAANLSTGEHTPYSAAAASAARARRPAPQAVTGPAPGRGLDVILVMLESWSPWHSAAWGGYQDWTPRLDAAAALGTAYTDFHALGFSTDRGLVGILAGQQVWSPFLHLFQESPFHSMWGVARTLPRAFSPHGYHTAFLTSGPLGLYRKGEWLSDLGFAEVEGNEHPAYSAEPRYAFGAASDGALYARALAWLESAPAQFLLVLETVTTHQPYTDPDTGQASLERAMKYADREFGEFLAALQQSGYFRHGVLAVVSDHRSMTPVPASEMDAWGAAALSRVPAFVIGPGFTAGRHEDRVFSQSDLVPSFELWLGGTTRLEAHQDVMFGTTDEHAADVPARQRCAFHGRMDQRGRIDVHCWHGAGQVRLDGDDSAFVSAEGLSAAAQADILATLAVLRLDGLERHQRSERTVAAGNTDD